MVAALAGAFERLVGTSWERFVRAQVLEPLGMTRALLGGEAPEDGNAAPPYLGEQAIPRRDTRAIAGAGGLHADVEDLARWLAFQLGAGPELLSAQSIALQRSEQAHARAEGRFEDPAYGIAELRDGDRGPVVEYAGQVWPLTFHSAESAVLVATYFGFPIPFPVAVEVERESISRLSIPLAMDPRVPPQVFTRVRPGKSRAAPRRPDFRGRS